MGARREENFAAERDEGVPQVMLLTFGTPHFGKPHSCWPGQRRQDQRQSMESPVPVGAAGRIKPAGSTTEQWQAFYRFQPLYAFYLLHPRYPSMSRLALSEHCLASFGVVRRYPCTVWCRFALPGAVWCRPALSELCLAPLGVVGILFDPVGRYRYDAEHCLASFGVVRRYPCTVSALSVRCPALPVCCPGLCRNRLLRQSLRAVLLPGLFFRGRLCRFPDRFSDGYFQGAVLADI